MPPVKFAQKVWMMPIMASSAFLLILTITWLGGQDHMRLMERIQKDYYQVIEHINNMHDVAVSLHQELADAAFLGDEDKLKNAEALAKEFSAVSTQCGSLDDSDEEWIAKTDSLFQIYYRQSTAVTRSLMEGTPPAAVRNEASSMNQSYENLLESLDELEHRHVVSMQTALKKAQKAQSENQSLIIGIIAICLAVLIGFSL